MEETREKGLGRVSFAGCRRGRRRKKVLIWFLALFLLAGLTGLGIQPVQAETGGGAVDMNWTWSNPLPVGNTLNGVTYGNGSFIAVGISGTILKSSDGINWTRCNSGTTDVLNKVTYGNGTFAAVGDLGVILTSSNGVDWVYRNSGTTASLYDVAYGDNTFVAVGVSGTILSSTDGINWSSRTSGTGDWLRGVSYGNGKFVSVGISGSILTSTDGVTWNYSDTAYFLNKVAYGNGNFVAVGHNGTVLNSSDGIDWSKCNAELDYTLNSLTYGNERFVIAEPGGTLTSSDGSNWTVNDYSDGGRIYDLTCGNGKFVAVGLVGTILTSSDGINWDEPYGSTWPLLYGVSTYGNGRFIAVGINGTIIHSSDGCNWDHPVDSGTTNTLNGVCYYNNLFVAVGDGGVILTSGDGHEWKRCDSGTTQNLNAVSCGKGKFLAVGDGGTIVSSDDGTTWTLRSSGTNSALNGVAFGAETFVAVGVGAILTSTDGINWEGNSRSYLLNGVDFCYDEFIAVGVSGTILISGNGHGWISCSSGTVADLKHATFGNNCFVVVGASGTVLSSTDAIRWNNCSSGTSYSLSDVSYGNGTFVTVGGRGTILTSTYTADANNAPQAREVSISGSPQIGSVLTGNYIYSDVENDPEGGTNLQWFRAENSDGSDQQAISGANTRNYTISNADRNRYLFLQVTPIATLGSSLGQAVLSPAFGPVMENGQVNWTDRPLLNVKNQNESLFVSFSRDLDTSSVNDNNIYCTSDYEGKMTLDGFTVQKEGSRQVKISPSSEGWPAGECYLFISSGVKSSSGQNLTNPIRARFTVSDVEFGETFTSPDSNWDFEDGWSVVNEGSNAVLEGKGHAWARLKQLFWDNHTMKCRLKLSMGGIHINYRNQNNYQKRYFVDLDVDSMSLSKQEGETFYNDLANAAWVGDADWHDIEIRGYQGIINFYMDGNLKMVYEDNDFIPTGIIAFETLDDSEAQVDDIEITPTNASDVTSN